MTVSIRNFSSGAGGPKQVTSFSDTFNRVSGPLGKNWHSSLVYAYEAPFNSPAGVFRGDIAAITGGGQGFAGTYTGSNNPAYNYSTAYVPVPTSQSLYGKLQQFVQVTFISITAGMGAGLGLFFNPELLGGVGTLDAEGYFMHMNSTGNRVFSFRMNGTGYTSLGDSGVIPANGDVWRMSVDAQTNSAQTTVVLKRNGVVMSTVNDNNAFRVNRGVPCMLIVSGTQVDKVEFTNFSCGQGL